MCVVSGRKPVSKLKREGAQFVTMETAVGEYKNRYPNGVTLRGTTEQDGVVYWRKVGTTEVKKRAGRSLVQHGGNQFCYLPGLPYEDYRPEIGRAHV